MSRMFAATRAVVLGSEALIPAMCIGLQLEAL